MLTHTDRNLMLGADHGDASRCDIDLKPEQREELAKLGEATISKPGNARSLCCNYITHKHAKVKSWLARHPRFQMQFTPTDSSWLNHPKVERAAKRTSASEH